MDVRRVLLRIAILLLPSYAAAWLTGEMVWVVPTLAASAAVAASMGATSPTRLDEDGDGEDGDPEADEAEDSAGLDSAGD